jgi:hypothetical protein
MKRAHALVDRQSINRYRSYNLGISSRYLSIGKNLSKRASSTICKMIEYVESFSGMYADR